MTDPILFALEQVKGAGTLDARKEPHRVTADESFQQADVARSLTTAGVSSTGVCPTRFTTRLLK